MDTFEKHKIRWVIFIIGSFLLAFNPSSGSSDVFSTLGQIVGVSLLCGLVAGIAFIVSVVIRKRLSNKQVWDIFFVAYGALAGLHLVGAILGMLVRLVQTGLLETFASTL
jgi:hypothetical protein